MTERREHSNAAGAVVLAAGRSTRMKSKRPKALHDVCGKPILFHILDALAEAGVSRRLVVVGHEADTVRTAVSARYGAAVEFALQTETLGTGHAVRMAEDAFADHAGPVLVLPGDTPLLSAQTLGALVDAHTGGATVLTAVLDDAGAYGRIVRDHRQEVAGIVEARDATAEQKAIREINAGVYAFDGPALFAALRRLTPDNAQGEYYLTDVVKTFRADGIPVRAQVSEDTDVVLGVNTRVELADVSERMRRRILRRWMLDGVTVVDPSATYVDADVRIGMDTVLLPGTHLAGRTVVGEDCQIGPQVAISDSVVGDRCRIGPFAHLRPGTVLESDVRIGNFVETKNAHLGTKVAAGHLTYLGDTRVGAGTNIGAGVITCNYDGFAKHPTHIGQNVFVGSHTTLIAPVSVGDGALTAAGSVITRDVPADALGVGRARQENREGWAATRRSRRAGAAPGKEPGT